MGLEHIRYLRHINQKAAHEGNRVLIIGEDDNSTPAEIKKYPDGLCLDFGGLYAASGKNKVSWASVPLDVIFDVLDGKSAPRGLKVKKRFLGNVEVYVFPEGCSQPIDACHISRSEFRIIENNYRNQ